jgi:hypothetical protein
MAAISQSTRLTEIPSQKQAYNYKRRIGIKSTSKSMDIYSILKSMYRYSILKSMYIYCILHSMYRYSILKSIVLILLVFHHTRFFPNKYFFVLFFVKVLLVHTIVYISWISISLYYFFLVGMCT